MATTNAQTRRQRRALLARVKQLDGEQLNRTEARDLAWLIKTDNAAAVDAWCEAVPKGDYCRLSGRQHKLVDDAARNYDLPIGEATIDLSDAICALHDLVAANAHRIRGNDLDGDRVDLEDEKLRAQIAKLRTENDKLAVQLQRERGEAIPVSQLRAALTELAAAMRQHGRAFQRISPKAGKLWNSVMKQLADEIESGGLSF